MATASQPVDDSDAAGMRARIRAHDWASTPLGPMADWPEPLRVALTLVENSAFPSSIYWGPEFRLLYNDAWAAIPGDRHPWALGRPAEEVWTDIWQVIGPQFREVMTTGKGLSTFDQMLPMLRDGVVQETYWNYSLTPIVGADGRPAGLFNQGNETTRAFLAERRLSFQVALSDRLRGMSDPVEVKLTAAEMLGERLGAARAGYGHIDAEQQIVSVRRDWVRDAGVMSLAGESRVLDAFGKDAIDLLRAGETLAVSDYRDDPRVLAEHAAAWEGIGVRALIVVPLARAGALTALLYVHESAPRRWRSAEIALARDVAERTWAAVERVQSEQALRDSEDHFRHAVELNPQISWTALPDGRLNRVSGRWFDWTGTHGLGDSWAKALHPDDVAPSTEAWRAAIETGETYDIEHRVRRRDGDFLWARSRAFPRRDADGRIILWYGATEDIDERKRGEEHQRLLVNELNHRVKNTLATVQAIAFQTLKGDIGLAEARGRFEARLLALSRAHNLLTAENWGGASLRGVVVDATGPLGGDRGRFDIDGADLWLAPRAALALALAFHELATNAVKYGALSREEGKVAIAWTIDGDKLRLNWKETGGPAVVEPASRGFGSRLIERGLAADLGGAARMAFEPDGLRCTIAASLAAVTAGTESD